MVPTLLAFVRLLLIFLYTLVVMLSSSYVSFASPAPALPRHEASAEVNALLKWKASLEEQSQDKLSSWAAGQSPCNSWFGIICDESKSITEIRLNDTSLSGSLHALNFSSLPNLLTFDISNSYFYGEIPRQMGTLSRLQYLTLSNNSI